MRFERDLFDADGNLTQDGRWVYSWDGENRLIAVETATNVENLVPKMKLDFTYDYQSRRVGKVVSVCSNSAWVAVRTNLFIYDGWNLIAEIQNSRSSSVPSTNFYVWGLDLSGSLQGAGGIGGLASAVLDGPSTNSTVFYAYDANGNVSDVINGDTGAIAAHYEYSPFGETVVQAGDAQVLALNPYAFSTKYLDRETSLYYYGQRFYNSQLGRWLSRDHIEEQGGLNVYAFVINAPVLGWDAIGMAPNPGEWNYPPTLPPKEQGKACCICKSEPNMCYIDLQLTGQKALAQRGNLPSPPNPPGYGIEQAFVGTAVLATLKHRGGKSVDGCHLHQSVERWKTGLSSDSPSPVHETAPNDYGADCHKPDYQFYGSTWLFDAPYAIWLRGLVDSDPLPDPIRDWFQAHDYVEEAPAVETWWGHNFFAKWNRPSSAPTFNYKNWLYTQKNPPWFPPN